MRKSSYLIIGLVTGISLSTVTGAMAENLETLIGKKVDSQAEVLLDGVALTSHAIIIEGRSYAPVRAVGEAAGLNVDWKDEKVVLNKKTTSELQAESKKHLDAFNQIQALQKQIDAIKAELAPVRKKMSEFESQSASEKTITLDEYMKLKTQSDEADKTVQDLYNQIKDISMQ